MSTQAPQNTEQRLTVLEETVAALRAEIDGYRELFTTAAASPVVGKLLASFGVKVPKGPPG